MTGFLTLEGMKTMRISKIFGKCCALLALALLLLAPAAGSAGVTFSDEEHVSLGSAVPSAPVWEARALPGAAGRIIFLGQPLSLNGGYGNTSAWNDSNVRQYLNGTFLTAAFSAEELAVGVLTPYGGSPVYDVTVPDKAYAARSTARAVSLPSDVLIPPSYAGDSLVWILDVQEIQAVFNGKSDLPWDDAAGYPARTAYAAGGPYLTRSSDPSDPAVIWTINQNGGFSMEPVSAGPSRVRPVISPDASAMLYKRGSGTEGDPYNAVYRWNVSPSVSASADDNAIILTFPSAVKNNGLWPAPVAWRITDDVGTTYSVTGTSSSGNRVTLTVFPALRGGAALTVGYRQRFDDDSQGLNNTKGAILRDSGTLTPFGLSDVTLTASVKTGYADGGVNDCGCGDSGCSCAGDAGDSSACGCVSENGLRVLSDSVHYLVLGQPFVLDLDADGGTAPYKWSARDGNLPGGLTLSEEGYIEGNAEAAGSFRVTVEATDSSGSAASKRFSFIVVEDEKLTIMTDSLPDAQAGRPYSARVRGCGGAKPYVWEITNLPDWLSLDPDSGVLSGTPTEPAIYGLTARLRDAEGTTDSMPLKLSVYPHDGLLIADRILPAAVLGLDYSATIEAYGGIAPYFFTVRRGFSLPPGLTLDGSGVLSGNPVEKGVYSFTADATDGNGLQGSALYTMAVLEEESLSPDAGGFAVREDEDGNRIFLRFALPSDFNETEVMAVDPLISPDVYAAGSASSITPVENGARSAELTVFLFERSPEQIWQEWIKDLALDGLVVRFGDGSGEEVRFENSLPLDEMKRETEDMAEAEGGEDGGGGCSAGWPIPLAALIAAMFKPKRRN